MIFGVFANPSSDEVRHAQNAIPGLRLQFSGEEPPELCESLANSVYLKAIHLGGPDGDDARRIARTAEFTRGIPLFDAWHPTKHGGTGITLAWSELSVAAKPAFFAVSGGLTAENVAERIRRLRPNAVDVRSGVESGGRKDESKVRAFVRAVREADAQA